MWPIADRPLTAAFDPLQTLDLLLRSRNRRGHANAFPSSQAAPRLARVSRRGRDHCHRRAGRARSGASRRMGALAQCGCGRSASARPEVAYNLGAVEKRQQEAACIDRRLREIRSLLTGSTSGLRSGSRPPLGQPQLWRPRTDVWQVAVAGQAAAHMPLGTRLGYAGLYGGFQWYAQKAEDETDAWSVLAELDDPGYSCAGGRRVGKTGPLACAGRRGQDGGQPAADHRCRREAWDQACCVEETSLTANSLSRLCAPLSSAG